jgi:uncharacterized protein
MPVRRADRGTMSKLVACPVHGSIALNDLEVRIVETSEFRRLVGVSQLGMANYVFPSATYNRFSHSIGACHIAGRMITTLRSKGFDISQEEEDLYRVAALLHDVGHYPFSHSMERAVERYSTKSFTGDFKGDPVPYVDHENLGIELITNPNSEINSVLKIFSMDPERIQRIIGHERPLDELDLRLANIVSSDLDADRIDYLSRTAHHTGAPYGRVDIDYLIANIQLDADNWLCLDPKAKRTAEHLLMARYFDYQQVSYHKTVAAYELLLERVIEDLLTDGQLDCSITAHRNRIADGTWSYFDDREIVGKMRSLGSADATALLQRQGPKLLGVEEVFATRMDKHTQDDKNVQLRQAVAQLAQQKGLDPRTFFVWTNRILMTKGGSLIDAGSVTHEAQRDAEERAIGVAVRIWNRETGTSTPIQSMTDSIYHVLSNQVLHLRRVYVFGELAQRAETRAELAKALSDLYVSHSWTTRK